MAFSLEPYVMLTKEVVLVTRQVKLSTLVKGDEGVNARVGILARGNLRGHRSSSTGELHVVQSLPGVIIIQNTMDNTQSGRGNFQRAGGGRETKV